MTGTYRCHCGRFVHPMSMTTAEKFKTFRHPQGLCWGRCKKHGFLRVDETSDVRREDFPISEEEWLAAQQIPPPADPTEHTTQEPTQ